jgi:disulfide oxidoreductase YuzD
MQSIKALLKFSAVVNHGVINNTEFRDIRLYNMNNISVSDDVIIDDKFYQCYFRTDTNDGGVLLLNLNNIECEMLEFCINHKIIKCITIPDTKNTMEYSHYYIGRLYYKKSDTCIYGVDDNNHTLFLNIAVKTTLNDTKTNETIEEIIALDNDKILLNLLKS